MVDHENDRSTQHFTMTLPCPPLNARRASAFVKTCAGMACRRALPFQQSVIWYVEQGLSWLALANDQPVGFILAEAHPSSLFIVELSVDLDWQEKDRRQLIACVADHARKLGLTSLTLTTFRDVPWNAPFYARLGFE
jgi:hypothetical protein